MRNNCLTRVRRAPILKIGMVVGLIASAAAGLLARAQDDSSALEARLKAERPAALVRNARIDGDPHRGARLFYSKALGCIQCHPIGGDTTAVGRDLTTPGSDAAQEDVVVSILDPSQRIAEGYETVVIATHDGRTITGVRPRVEGDTLTLVDAAEPGKLVTIKLDDIEERRDGGASVMPAGLVNNLASRQEFLDLVRYVLEIREGGPERARMLKPSAFEMAAPPLPPYESRLDHARLIRESGAQSLKQGRAIYQRACASCHGTPGHEGSLPSSPKFWADRLKSEGDPLRMYQTITGGQGLMPPQTWLVPRQKYDVIHFIRETMIKPENPGLYRAIDEAYLASLPPGTDTGPDPSGYEPYVAMDYGNVLTHSYELPRGSGVFAYKGIATRLDPGKGGISQGRSFAVYDHDTMRLAAIWTGAGFIDWRGIQFNGEHQIHPASAGVPFLANSNGPGWANPATGSFDDPRAPARDGVRYGPMPKDWLKFLGRYDSDGQAVLHYEVGDALVLESTCSVKFDPAGGQVIVGRALEVGPSKHDLTMLVGPESVSAALVGETIARMTRVGDKSAVRIPARADTVRFGVLLTNGSDSAALAEAAGSWRLPNLQDATRGGRRRWPDVLTTSTQRFDDEGPFGIDVLTLPDSNPWNAQLRPTGFDFFADGDRAAVCTWDGDVWKVSGLASSDGVLSWQRIASGLFQPLGLKVIDGLIYVGCRDQIVILRDLNGDGETDYYENFNSDHQVTEHFHEFAMGLQTDAAGNLYYAKAARHALPAVVPQHGTLLRVSPDGSRTDILAHGFRAPNGVCLNDDGTFFVTDQEGHWIPKNRLNWIDGSRNDFYGNMMGYTGVTDVSDSAMRPPVCWITNTFDRSPAEPLWVASERWGPLNGALLSLSYGYGQVFVVPHERRGEVMQGAMVALPLPRFPTGLIRGRFSPRDGQLYVCGMYSWAGSQTRPGGLFRIRATERPVHLPIRVRARAEGLELTFTDPLDPRIAGEVGRYGYTSWGLRRSENYGSPHVGERKHAIEAARLSEDGRTLTLRIAEFAPTPCYELTYQLIAGDGEPFSGRLDGTIHAVDLD